MKSTILLATAIFLASAPSPDSKSISEISAGFLSVNDSQGLMAAESEINVETDRDTTRLLAEHSKTTEDDKQTTRPD